MIIKFLRILIIICIILSLITGFIALGLKFFSKYRLAGYLVNGTRGMLNRELKLEKTSFGLFDGFYIEKFSISKYPGFNSGTLASAEKLVLKTRILRLFERKNIINKAQLDSPLLNISGKGDFTGLLPAGHMASAHFFPIMFSIAEISVKNGRIEYSSKDNLSISDINLSINNFGVYALSNFNFSFVLHKKSDIAVNGNGTFNAAGQEILFNSVTIKAGRDELNLSGKAENVYNDNDNLKFTLYVNGKRSVFESVKGFIPGYKDISFFDTDKISLNLSYCGRSLKVISKK
jgi:uncharacterized protein involved in outer membrane biogenesis